MATLILIDYETFDSNRWRFYDQYFTSILERQSHREAAIQIRKQQLELFHQETSKNGRSGSD